MNKSETLAAVCHALTHETSETAASILNEYYPFAPEAVVKRRYGPIQATQVFVRDGFIDRYSGERLIFPPVFRILSIALPNDFPYHPAWKTEVTHPAYWELGATVDHFIPVTRGGSDKEPNFYTTSMAHNYAKMNWTLEELGWQLHPKGDIDDWDGMIHWFLDYTALHPEMLANASIRQWHKAATSILRTI